MRSRLSYERQCFYGRLGSAGIYEYLNYDANGRGNLGDERTVMVYRMLEFSLKDEIIRRFGKEEQIDIFRKAGRKAGEHFTRQH